MKYSILGKEVFVYSVDNITGRVFSVTGSGLSKIGLPDLFLFQMPGKFSLPLDENIMRSGNLANLLSETQELNLLSKFLEKRIWKGDAPDHNQ